MDTSSLSPFAVAQKVSEIIQQLHCGLTFVKSMSWDEVFALWEKDEATLPRWIAHYEKRGFDSWRAWRSSTVSELHPEQLTWNLYKIADPMYTVPQFHAGPFRAWIKKYYGEKQTLSFQELATNPEIQQDANINEIVQKFPQNSMLIGLMSESRVVIIEGLHRCLALAIANARETAIAPQIYIAIADFPDALPLLGQEDSPT